MKIKIGDNAESANEPKNGPETAQAAHAFEPEAAKPEPAQKRRPEESLRKDVEAEENELRGGKKKEKNRSRKVLNPNPVSNEDYYQNYKKRVRNNRIKRLCVYGTMLGTLFAILILNLYFIFVRERVSIPEIAAQVKNINKINNYPTESVDGYLQEHGLELISGMLDLSNGSGAKTFSISGIRVNKIAVRSDNNANVYFSCYVTTNVGSELHNFLLPLYYSSKTSSFAPSGDLILCAAQNNSTVEPIEASLWGFEKIKRYNKEETVKLTNFLSNFLEILYNNPDNDLGTFYSGDSKLGDYACSFLGIQECSYYQESNAMGLNCELVYTLKSNEGVVFTVHNYAAVKKVGDTYEIVHFY